MLSIVSLSNIIMQHSSSVALVSNDHSSLRAECRFASISQLCRRSSKAVSVPIEHYTFAFSSRAIALFHPLTPPGTPPKASDIPPRSIFNIAPVMFTHHRLDRFGRFVGVVEGDCADIVV